MCACACIMGEIKRGTDKCCVSGQQATDDLSAHLRMNCLLSPFDKRATNNSRDNNQHSLLINQTSVYKIPPQELPLYYQ